jgi:hypothetical protein
MIDALNHDVRESGSGIAHPQHPAAAAPAKPVGFEPVEPDLPDEQVRILQALAAAVNDANLDASDAGVPLGQLAVRAEVTPARLKFHAQALDDRGLAQLDYWPTGTWLRLQPAGSEWLMKRDLMPD